MAVCYLSADGGPVKTRGAAARRSLGGAVEYHFRATFRLGGRQTMRHFWARSLEDALLHEALERDPARKASSLTWTAAAEIYLAKKQ